MISEETKQRIEREARKHVHNLFPYGNFKTEEDYHGASYDDYIAGATAEAEKAQRLADALLSAKAYLTGLSSGGGHMFTSIPPIITEIDNALQQWRGEK